VEPGVDDGEIVDRETEVLRALAAAGDLSRRDIEKATGLGQIATPRILDALMADGKVESTAPSRSPHRRYRLVLEV